MQDYRIEVDLLGERKVPNDVYWGIHTLRAIENFNISKNVISDVPEFVRGMVMVKKATALANGELGAIPKKIAKAIVQACDEVLVNGRCMDQFPSDIYQGGAGTSVNMNTNEVIANLALEILGHKKGEYSVLDPMDHVNASQSTNDAYPTGFRIAVYNSVMHLISKILYLQQSFENKANEFANVLKMGRTQLQDAVPMTVGQEFKAFSVLLDEEVRNLKRTAELLLEVNLGATAIGTGLNTPEGYAPLAVKYLSEVTQLPCTLAGNLIEATSDCGAYVMVHGALKRTAVKLSKVCNDLRLLSSGPRAGLNEINLPELQAGSSIMPAKVNPVVPEVVNQVCFKVMGNDITVTMAAEAGQLQLNVMEPVIGQAMFESIDILANACVNLRDKCIDGITVNKEICENFVFNSIGIVTYLNPFIGHHEGDIVGKICATTGKGVREVVLERGLLTKEQLDDILSVENLMHPTYKAKRFEEE
ncbi:Aspartate ammonia-lyase [Bibersteinia trehalosi USDA-ARS-USMARC-188]|uniref:Aspartate ammonia-lyase n=5 Tax=Bibersteinia trehalosi TaxID=47735 RepID=W0R8H5_BIBTR|nr:aspartate ammonia-lyase [Bibersteinia trehalosi]AGH38752.1 Aspartate ammonia-lyase [Bibersteinia trehalosi USDA-ARS-USMARC-192]AHG81449.1 Aspartate ammonia-lyase [Bibersteinia trehalosi USDA-ARS-USMARC-188]AHG83717.1 Aspartate ammonia-lyase [Bibersteinia trehalosi USDA-ARS-USMARC-189]AHG86737.1 Aspartate ammonia-lyase [Bibersteinia trehalosi USDA-ARS-USMARC-190]OAQ14629.1 aspartate ammonia-lyase [Bibersteinia trehalosi Y31]